MLTLGIGPETRQARSEPCAALYRDSSFYLRKADGFMFLGNLFPRVSDGSSPNSL